MKKCNNKNIKSILKYECIIMISVLLYMSSTLYGANYYVSTNGDNTAVGTNWALAWKTINYAATQNVSSLGPGDVVTVSNGIYNEQVNIQSNGTSGNYIIFKAFNHGQVVVDGSGNSYCFYLNGKSYIRIEGFKITKATNSGIHLDNDSTNNYFVNNSIYLNEDKGIWIQSDTADNNYILSNKIWGTNQNTGIYINDGDYNTIKSNQIYNNDEQGIVLDGAASNSIMGLLPIKWVDLSQFQATYM